VGEDLGELLVAKDVKRFRGGIVFKARTLLYHATLGWRVIKKKKNLGELLVAEDASALDAAAFPAVQPARVRARIQQRLPPQRHSAAPDTVRTSPTVGPLSAPITRQRLRLLGLARARPCPPSIELRFQQFSRHGSAPASSSA